ncbi:MAG: FAD-dependent oxidoreductase [Hyphomicrobiales bacterium]|nr:FAD-dependent oxidoreductase [Hyphomicrobiales bacterium]
MATVLFRRGIGCARARFNPDLRFTAFTVALSGWISDPDGCAGRTKSVAGDPRLTRPSSGRPLRVAVVGAGISGLSAAWLLSQTCDVTLYEAQDRLGGHSDTFDWDGAPVDCGFIVYNERTYPNLTALFARLGVATRKSDMSFSVSIDRGRLEYSGGGPRGLIAQPSNLVRARYWSMLKDLVRFFRAARRDVGRAGLGTLDEYLDAGGYGRAFRDDYLYPMAAAIWSTPALDVGAYPAENFIRFNLNHGLLELFEKNRPIWRTVEGGSRAYVARLAQEIRGAAICGRPVRSVRRTADGLVVTDESGAGARFDRVVMATHADQSLRLIEQPTRDEKDLLGAFRYVTNEAVLHTDLAAMPRRRAAWSSWNYMAERSDEGRRLSVTYWMNRLQGIQDRAPVFVSLNPIAGIAPSKILRSVSYEHPLFNAQTLAAQQNLWSLQGVGGLWHCGAWFGYGFHEDGLQSGLAVAEEIGGVQRPWSTPDMNDRLPADRRRRADAVPALVA